MNWLNTLGLCFDIVGAVILARAVIWELKKKIALKVATTWDYNVSQVSGFVSQRVDAAAGLIILVAGFVLQGWSNWWQTAPVSVFWIGIVALAILVATYAVAALIIVPRESERVVDYLNKQGQKKIN